MKISLLIIISLVLHASLAMGDEVDSKLSHMANERIRLQTRAMINAGIPTEEAIKITRMMIQKHFQQKNILRSQQALSRAIKYGLPIEPIMNKAYEGMAKNKAEDSIVQAMEKVRNRYSYAYRKASEFTKDRDRMERIGSALAEGFTAGITRESAELTMQRLRQRTAQMPQTRAESLTEESFLSLRTMARLGVSSKDAADVVCQALQNEYSAKEMKQMRHSFMTQSMNTEPSELAQHYAHSIGQGARAENIGTDRSGKNGGWGGSGGGSGGGEGGGSGGGGGGGGGR